MSKICTNDIYEKIVDSFKQELREGKNPFSPVGQPSNISTNRNYSGFNKFHLSGICKEKEYPTLHFATYKQISNVGGQIRKGEKSYPVFFWGVIYFFKGSISVSAESLGDALLKAQKKKSSINEGDYLKQTMYMKHFSVFNVAQSDGCKFDEAEEVTNSVDLLMNATQSKIENANIPRYSKDEDVIYYPKNPNTEDESLVLKAIVETTGHHSRLNREFEYAEEELITSIGASFIAKSANVEDISFNKDLIDSWLEVLGKKPMFLYKAASQAQKATELLFEKTKELLIAA